MSPATITVPDLIGLTFSEAFRIGTGIGLSVVGVAPDGTPVAPTSEGAVVEQEPVAGAALKVGRTLSLRVGRPPGGSGDRVPVDPGPRGLEGESESDPTLPPGDRSRNADPDSDPDLVPA
ncbi:PASTA domain-containing protein [Nakamurella sp. YIM 132087]|uniref:PASTA domain-containing protein n=1 Tax=Nakamurella alba TaxID=2665158 RepID=A0A7K1FKA0_9ACTN|nr:PASTA domain-containing protein [Nakamurella alba]MTD14567.1 PASTA domain-containing protein [Nakamurella alba]